LFGETFPPAGHQTILSHIQPWIVANGSTFWVTSWHHLKSFTSAIKNSTVKSRKSKTFPLMTNHLNAYWIHTFPFPLFQAAFGGSTRPPYGGGWRPLGPISPLSHDDTRNRAAGQPVPVPVAVPFAVGAGTAVGTGVKQPRMPPAAWILLALSDQIETRRGHTSTRDTLIMGTKTQPQLAKGEWKRES